MYLSQNNHDYRVSKVFFLIVISAVVPAALATLAWIYGANSAQAQDSPQQLLSSLNYRAAGYQASLTKQEKHPCHVAALLSRSYANTSDSYCFYYGCRYDEHPANIGGRVNPDLEYGDRSDSFRLNFNGGNDSFILDLGAVNFNDVTAPAAIGSAGEAKAVNGHVYVMSLINSDYMCWVKMQILDMAPGKWIIFRWERLNQYPIAAGRSGIRWDGRFYADNRGNPDAQATKPMKAGIVKLQLRSGAGGGNPNQISMAGDTSIYVNNVQWTPITMTKTIDMDDKSTAYYYGGYVPKGKVWVVKKITYSGLAKGDSNGHGGLEIRIAGWLIAHEAESPWPFSGTCLANIPVSRGQERYVYAEVPNSSECTVTIEGDLVPETDPKAK